MRNLLCVITFVWLLTGCAAQFAEYSRQVEALDKQMSQEWLAANVTPGKTTRDQIIIWFGKPFSDTSTSSTGIASAFMPDEMMIYSVRFSKPEGSGLSCYTDHWVKTVTFSFKGGAVSDYTVTKNSF